MCTAAYHTSGGEELVAANVLIAEIDRNLGRQSNLPPDLPLEVASLQQTQRF